MEKAGSVWEVGKEEWIRKMGGIFPVSMALPVCADCTGRMFYPFLFSAL